MKVFLRQELTSALIDRKFDGKEGLIVEWEERCKADEDFPHPRARSSVYKWVAEGVPGRRNDLIAFCALLDVDPLALFDYEKNGYFDRFARIRRNLQFGLKAVGQFYSLFKMFAPEDKWPSDDLALKCYGRKWFSHEFANPDDWEDMGYALLRAKFAEEDQGDPRAVHIAYRRLGSPDTMWRFYGTVISIDGHLHLYNEGGDYQHMPQMNENEIRFRTYFGGRPVEFRMVSLHEFAIEKEYPYSDMNTIGFDW